MSWTARQRCGACDVVLDDLPELLLCIDVRRSSLYPSSAGVRYRRPSSPSRLSTYRRGLYESGRGDSRSRPHVQSSL